MADDADLVESNKDHLIASWRNVLILVWRQDTTVGGVQKLKASYDALADKFPKNVFLLTIVEQNAPMPPAPRSPIFSVGVKGRWCSPRSYTKEQAFALRPFEAS